ncbi:MAG: hypothetical protein WCW67_03975 [Candidatus Margulisiibacteriota bacterium]|jgi:hypothetical protein
MTIGGLGGWLNIPSPKDVCRKVGICSTDPLDAPPPLPPSPPAVSASGTPPAPLAQTDEGTLFATPCVQVETQVGTVKENRFFQNGAPLSVGGSCPAAVPAATITAALINGVDTNNLRDSLLTAYKKLWGEEEGPRKFAGRRWNITDLIKEYNDLRFSTDQQTRSAFTPALGALHAALKKIQENAQTAGNTNLAQRISNEGFNYLPPLDPTKTYGRREFFAAIGDADGSMQDDIAELYGPAKSKKLDDPWSLTRFLKLSVYINDRQKTPAFADKTKELLPAMRAVIDRLVHLTAGDTETFFNQFGNDGAQLKAAIGAIYGKNSDKKMAEAWTSDRFIKLYVYLIDHQSNPSFRDKTAEIMPLFTAVFTDRIKTAAPQAANPANRSSLAPLASDQFFAQFGEGGNSLRSAISAIYGSAAANKMEQLWTVARFTKLYRYAIERQNNPTDKDKMATALPLMRQALFQLLAKAQPTAGQPAPTEPSPAIAQIAPLLKVGEFDATTFQAVVTNTIEALARDHKKEGPPLFDANKIKADPRYKALQALMRTDSFMNPEFAKEGNPVKAQIAGWKDNRELGRGCLAIFTTLYSTTAGQPTIIDGTTNPAMIASLGIMTENAAADAAAINTAAGIVAAAETPAPVTGPTAGSAVPAGTEVRRDVNNVEYARYTDGKFYTITPDANAKWGAEYTDKKAPKPGTRCYNPITDRGNNLWTATGDDGKEYIISYNNWTNTAL